MANTSATREQTRLIKNKRDSGHTEQKEGKVGEYTRSVIQKSRDINVLKGKGSINTDQWIDMSSRLRGWTGRRAASASSNPPKS